MTFATRERQAWLGECPDRGSLALTPERRQGTIVSTVALHRAGGVA